MRFLLISVLVFFLFSPCDAATEIRGSVLAAGGGTTTTTNHSMHYTIGQSLARAKESTANHTMGSGFWGASPHVTAAGPEPLPLLPSVDRLYQNLPNPFNPFTTIHYDLAGDGGPVSLRIYDVAGHLVTTLVDQVQPAGRHSVIWRGEDARGSRVASGIYVYELKTQRASYTKKMVLLQ